MSAEHAVKQILQPHLDQGLELWLEGEALRFKAPKELMTQELVAVLKANKPGILAWLKAEAAAEQSPRQAELVDEYPLAFTQGAIWMLYKFAPNSPAYNTTFACTLVEGIEEAAVRQAFHALMVRHPVLRSTFTDTEQGPRQRVWSHLPMPLQIIDGSPWNEAQLQEQLDQEADAPFDLQNESCLRVKIFRNTVQGDILIATIQHVGADLWALLVVAQDIKQFYQQAAQGEALSVQPVAATYRQHVEWQQAFMDSARGKHERFYWQQQLNGAPLAISLPEDLPRPPLLKLEAKTRKHSVSQQHYQAIKQFCKQQGITPFVFVQTAFQLMVHHHTGAQDFLIGTPTMGRARKGMDEVVGDFANPVVLRATVQPQLTLRSLFNGVKRTLLAAMEHQECPFPIVVQDCNPPRDSSRTPLFQLMFVWHQGNAEMMPKDGFIQEVLPMSGPRGAPYDVMLAVSDLGDHFELNWTYQTSLYRPETVDGFARDTLHWMQSLLQASVDDSVAQLAPGLAATSPSEQEIELRARALALEPRLQQHDFTVLVDQVADQTSAHATFQRLFIACSPEQGQSLQAPLLALFQDVVSLTELPRTATGEVDRWALRQLTALDQQTLRHAIQDCYPQQEPQQPDGAHQQDLVILRQRQLLPTYSREELSTKSQGSVGAAPPRAVDIDTRPDAWMVGSDLPAATGQAEHLFTALQQTAHRAPEKGFLFVSENGDELLYTYAQLEQDAYRAAAGLRQSELKPGDILLLQMRFDARFFAVWWGAVLCGIRPLVVATPEHYHERNGVAQKLYNVAHNFEALVIAADRERVDSTRTWLGDGKQVVDADGLLQHDQHYRPDALSDDPVAFLQLTSGSTGTPKAIQITHRGILHHVAASAHFNDYSADDVSLNWLPFDHVVPILTTHLKDIILGIQQVQLPTAAVLADPLLWLRAMSRYRVNFSWAPNFAFQRVVEALRNSGQDDDSLGELDLRCVKILMNAGEQVLEPVVRDFSAALSSFGLHPDAVQPAFGMAEACTCMTYNNQSSRQLSVYFRATHDLAVVDVVEREQATHGFIDLGPVIPGVEVRITDQQNQLVKEGVIGRMQIRGPVITPGYLSNPEANAEAFVGDGWFNSGDLGFIWNQRLILTGREKEMIVVNGANYYCFELEQVAAGVDGVVPTFVAATGVSLDQGTNSDALVLFYVAEQDAADSTALERRIIARVTESFSVVARYVIAVDKEAFYKTTSGKIQRGQFKKLFESGFYAEQVADFDERHGHTQQGIDTVFALQHQRAPLAGDKVPEANRLTLEQLRNNPQTLQQALDHGHALIELGQYSFQQDGAATLYRLTQVLAELTASLRPLSTAGSDTAVGLGIALWLQSDDKAALSLVQPLAETLRQETGLQQLACVLTPGDLLPVQPAPGSIVWQESDHQEQLRLLNVPQSPIPNEVISRRGVYLITGGLGGLAEPLCAYLVEARKATVLLSGRTPLSQDPRRQSRFNQLTARYGSGVHYLCLSEWSSAAIQSALEPVLNGLGDKPLDGVFHLAGTMAMAPLTEVSPAHWNSVLDAKVQGGQALADYLGEHWPRSILVQYGSVNGYFGGQAAAAYSAAAALQSAITDAVNARSSVRSWCLNWSVWQGAGMARAFSSAELQMARNKGFLPLSIEQDSVLIPRLLQLAPANYFIGLDPGNAEIQKQCNPWPRSKEIIQFFVNASTTSRPEQLRTVVQSVQSALMAHAHTPQFQVQMLADGFEYDSQGRVRLDLLQQQLAQSEEQGEAPANKIEQDLAAIWSDVLGRPVADVSRSFFEYGGHSINATQVVSAINNKLGLPITVANLFQYPTIRELAQVAVAGNSEATLSLTLKDCIARGDDYSLDAINPATESATKLVFLPTALGLPSAYGQMAASLSSYQMLAVTVPATDVSCTDLDVMASRLINLLERESLIGQQTVLIGWSMAGVLGYEVLAQLAAADKPLPRLVMLDSGFADGLHEITFDESFQRLMFAVEVGLTIDRYADFNQLQDDNTKLQWLKQYLETIGIEVSEEMLVEWWQAYYKRLKSLLTYQQSAELVNADIHLFKAALHSHGRDDLGWNDNNNRIKWTLIQADHQGIVKQPETFQRIRELLA